MRLLHSVMSQIILVTVAGMSQIFVLNSLLRFFFNKQKDLRLLIVTLIIHAVTNYCMAIKTVIPCIRNYDTVAFFPKDYVIMHGHMTAFMLVYLAL